LTTYYSQIICFLLLPFYLAPVKHKQGSGSKVLTVTSLPIRKAGPLLVKLLFLECLIISWFSSLEASIERTSLLFPERIAPTCLFNLCQAICYFIFCTGHSLAWGNISEKDDSHLEAQDYEERPHKVSTKDEIELTAV
jgi:hypothetical protein